MKKVIISKRAFPRSLLRDCPAKSVPKGEILFYIKQLEKNDKVGILAQVKALSDLNK